MGWRENMRDALAARCCLAPHDWARENPGVHCWFRFQERDQADSCACCGIVRRHDDLKPCPGVVKIELRDAGGTVRGSFVVLPGKETEYFDLVERESKT